MSAELENLSGCATCSAHTFSAPSKPSNVPFDFVPLLPLGPETHITYDKLDLGFTPEVTRVGNHEFISVPSEIISKLTTEMMFSIQHYFAHEYLDKLVNALADPELSDNDRSVISCLLHNATIAANGSLPSCQDTGTAIVHAHRGAHVLTDLEDEKAISRGIYDAYQLDNLRYSQNSPIDMFKEVNTKTNLPADITIEAGLHEPGEYFFQMVAKGGGSSNKTQLFQKTKAVLNPESLEQFLRDEIAHIGTAACPPYHIAVVIGGTTPERNLLVAKLASCRFLDTLPTEGSARGHAYRDLEYEKIVLKIAQETGYGAQFGGKAFAIDARVIRMPRHGASCPIGLAVACSADRQIRAKINKNGVFIQHLCKDPSEYLKHAVPLAAGISLNTEDPDFNQKLKTLRKGDRVNINGRITVARDIAHAKFKEIFDATGSLPEYLKKPIFYAGPAKTPEGLASGSFGPTTSQRMDPYVPLFQPKGFSLCMIGKGNRSPDVAKSCAANGGVYLGTIGGGAAYLALNNIKHVDVIDFEELGMEAVWSLEVEDFPCFVLIDSEGGDLYKH